MAFEINGILCWWQYTFVLRSGRYITGNSHCDLGKAIQQMVGFKFEGEDHSEILSVPGYYKLVGLMVKAVDVEYVKCAFTDYNPQDERDFHG